MAQRRGDVFRRGDVALHFDCAEDLYAEWPAPTCIICDGPYGVSGFPGDEHKADALLQWYEPHVGARVCAGDRRDDAFGFGEPS